MSDYDVILAKISDKKEIYNLSLESFFPDFPLFYSFNITEPLGIDEWPALQAIKDNLTLIAVNKSKEIMGVAINVTPKDGIPIEHPKQVCKKNT